VAMIEADRGEAHVGTLLVKRERIVREGCAASKPECSQSQRRFVASHNRELKRPPRRSIADAIRVLASKENMR